MTYARAPKRSPSEMAMPTSLSRSGPTARGFTRRVWSFLEPRMMELMMSRYFISGRLRMRWAKLR